MDDRAPSISDAIFEANPGSSPRRQLDSLRGRGWPL